MAHLDRSLARRRLVLTAGICLAPLLSTSALAQQATSAESGDKASPTVLGEIIVTAEKREQSLSTVPMSVTAAPVDLLRDADVKQVRDLAKVTPGFKYSDSLAGTPVYSLRGVGFDDISLAGRPTVSVYQDQFPVPFAIETRGAGLDVERVEVLKGPQGTLFGNNATGGAINYIAAKPTEDFEAGVDFSYGNYDAMPVSGFLSGPVTDTLAVRLAFEHDGMGDWQTGYTTKEKTGKVDFSNARLLMVWQPTDQLSASLAVSRWIDRSDSQAAYLLGTDPNQPWAADLFPEIFSYPLPPKSNDKADFTPGEDFSKDNNFTSYNGRIDYKVSDALTLTSLTHYSEYSGNQLYDTDGIKYVNNELRQIGTLDTFAQELRAFVSIADAGHVTLGAFYESDRGRETNTDTMYHGTLSTLFLPLGGIPLNGFGYSNNQNAKTKAAFASADYGVTDAINVYGGVRYTKYDLDFWGCSSDTGDGSASSGFTILANLLRGGLGLDPIDPLPPGACFTLDETYTPGLVRNSLHEDNTSWRAGIQMNVAEDTLVYANVSQGYKAGGFPTILATVASQEVPATQESLLAFEVGLKSTLLDRTMRLNAAAFYYDYQDKQILGRVLDPVAGPITVLVNIPKSKIVGGEVQLDWLPVEGLTISAGASYIHSEILDHYTDADPNGEIKDFNGEPFPNTPKWHVVGDAEYVFPTSGSFEAFVGGNFTYQSDTNGQLGQLPILHLPSYSLIDLRAGVQKPDKSLRAWLWVRNAGDTFYLTSANRLVDTWTAYTGMPRTYGASVSYRF